MERVMLTPVLIRETERDAKYSTLQSKGTHLSERLSDAAWWFEDQILAFKDEGQQ